MRTHVCEFFLDACRQNNFKELIHIYECYIEVNIDKQNLNHLTRLDHSIINDNVDILLQAFGLVANKKIMEWLYLNLQKHLDKCKDIISISLEEVYSFWLKTFKTATYKGDKKVVRWLWEKTLTDVFGYRCVAHGRESDLIFGQGPQKPLAEVLLTDEECESFRNACSQGHVQVAELLYDIGYMYGWPIDLHCHSQLSFYWACQSGHLEMAKWIYRKAKSIAKPFTNLEDIYETMKVISTSHYPDKCMVLEWLIELDELEVVSTEWILVNDKDVRVT